MKAAVLRLGEIGLANYPPYLMNRIMGRYNAEIRAEMGKLGLTIPKMRALAVLSVMDGQLVGQLAIHAIVEQSTLSRALDALQSEGLVRREVDASDSRAIRVFITDAGLNAFETLWPHMAETYQDIFRGIAAEELRDFVVTLQKIHANIQKAEV